jgi:predicted hotdog family 3-hydroxylacyl-ACP dehydratase
MTNLSGAQYVYYAKSAVGPTCVTASSHPLWRRMTWTSKALIEAVSNWEHAHGLKLYDLTRSHRVSFYYATLFGEMEAGVTVAAGILKESHVVSPAAFQQSVHNSPVAYLMQMLQCENPTMTIASGHGSFDRALATASSDLLANTTDIAVVLHAAEYHLAPQPESVTATAELALVTAGQRIEKKAMWCIESVLWTESMDAQEHLESENLFIQPLNLEHQEKSFIRQCHVGHGRSIVSSWQKMEPHGAGAPASRFIPHRDTMLLVDSLIEAHKDGSARVSATLKAATIVFENGKIRPQCLVEVLAQAAGVGFNAIRHLKTTDAPPLFGYLLSIDDFDASAARHCKPDDVLDIHVTLISDLFPLGKYFVAAYHDGVLVAQGSMKFLSDENSELAKSKVNL